MTELEMTIRILVVPLLLYIAYEHVKIRERVAGLVETTKAMQKVCSSRADWIGEIDKDCDELGKQVAEMTGEQRERASRGKRTKK